RSGMARALCAHWQWRSSSGRLKERSALGILTELARQGWIELPPAGRTPLSAEILADALSVERSEEGPLNQYRPLRWELVSTTAQRREWRELLARHHYLGAPTLVGANLKYLVYGRAGQPLGALGWHSAVQHLGCRDRLLGWDAAQRARGLEHVVNGVRFLVLPWVKVRHLASVMLSENLGLLQRDWPRRYGMAVWLAESFVDRQRFSGASYRAANWQAIGWTRGFAKRQGRFVHHGQSKEVYVYVMEARMRQLIHGEQSQPLLTRAFLLAQRLSEEKTLTKRRRMKNILASWKPKLPPQCDLSEEDLATVGRELSEFAALFGPTFARRELGELFELYLQGLLSDAQRKNVEAMVLRLDGPERVRNLQRFMCDYRWDEPWLGQRHWELCAQALSDPQGVWSLDASEFPKKGDASVGVAPQYCGAQGKTANCQSGVFIGYSSAKGHALLEGRLYLPRCWFEPAYEERRRLCRIPQDTAFKTKQQLALELLPPLLATHQFGGRWITCDCSFGNNEPFLEQLPKDFYYLAEIACTRKVWPQACAARPQWEQEGCTVEQLLELKALWNWQTHKIAEGQKGPLVAAFARLRIYLSPERTPESQRWLLLRNDANCKIKYALSNAPQEVAMRELVRVSGARWPIERCFQENKSELGLDHYEHRSWTAWHRHVRLVCLAQLFLVRLQIKFKKKLPR
ncbi:MAG TPA: IS701 family transposase, partial [Candidatus Saccharimonadia bacterium]|nr:IS701 family transposase [Candidatus Saccharimonadia bacterium]